MTLTFGEVIILLALIAGIVAQYLGFLSKFSRFEGYTTAKLELLEKSVNSLLEILTGHIEGKDKKDGTYY